LQGIDWNDPELQEKLCLLVGRMRLVMTIIEKIPDFVNFNNCRFSNQEILIKAISFAFDK
jgi:uncharacterized membrane protein